MIYFYFRAFFWLCNIFGMKKPMIITSKKQFRFRVWNKIWSLFIIACILADYSLTKREFDFDIKKDLNKISQLNEVIVNVTIMLIEFLNKDEIYIKLYEKIDNSFQRFNVASKNLKALAFKLYLWISIPTILFIAAIILDVLKTAPLFVFLIKIPTFFTFLHLVAHLYLVLCLLKKVNFNLDKMFMFGNQLKIDTEPVKPSVVNNLFNIIKNNIEGQWKQKRFNIKFLCRVYADISSCVKLLEKCHGFQVLLITWLMFSSAVSGITLVVSKQAEHSLALVTSFLPFFWYCFGCFFEDQIRKEVVRTEHLIIKHLVDFRCDQSRKNTLQSFKQLVSTHRLQFTSCDLFDMNYSMVLGTIVHIITYTIILIQFLMSKD